MYEMSLPIPKTVQLFVRIPVQALISVYEYSVFILFCAGRGLATGLSPVKGDLPTVYRFKKLKRSDVSKAFHG
jgi:hypothetical protein